MYNIVVNICFSISKACSRGTRGLHTKPVYLIAALLYPHAYTLAFLDDAYEEVFVFDEEIYFFEITLFELLVFVFSSITFFVCYFIFKNEASMNRNHVIGTFFLIFFSVLFLSRSSSLLSFFFYYELLLLSSVYLVWLSSPNRRSKYTSFYFLF